MTDGCTSPLRPQRAVGAHGLTGRCAAPLADVRAAAGHGLGGRFLSPLDADARSVNSYPVLVGERDEAILGTTIMFPTTRSCSESLGGWSSIHGDRGGAAAVRQGAASDGERQEIASGDPAVREMVARAETATPEQILSLHGRITMRDPREASRRRRSTGSASCAAATSSCAPDPTPNCTPGCSTAARRRSSGSSSTWTARCTGGDGSTATRAMTCCARRTGCSSSFREVEVVEPILVAGVGNAGCVTTASVARPPLVQSATVGRRDRDGRGTGGLDLAYEVMPDTMPW